MCSVQKVAGAHAPFCLELDLDETQGGLATRFNDQIIAVGG
jgi:hypothetical protein